MKSFILSFFYIFQLKKKGAFMLQNECFNQFCYMSEKVSSFCFLFALFTSIFLSVFTVSKRKRGPEE